MARTMVMVTLEELNKNVLAIKKELDEIHSLLSEKFELADDVKEEIKESRKRVRSEFIGHDDIVKEFA